MLRIGSIGRTHLQRHTTGHVVDGANGVMQSVSQSVSRILRVAGPFHNQIDSKKSGIPSLRHGWRMASYDGRHCWISRDDDGLLVRYFRPTHSELL